MFTRFACFCTCCLASVSLLASVTGCSKEEESKSTAPAADVAKPAISETDTQPEVEAKLAKADLLDGKADKIVTRCASCGLKMDGSSEHTLKVLDYTLYFCKEECVKGFAENTTESILALEIPED